MDDQKNIDFLNNYNINKNEYTDEITSQMISEWKVYNYDNNINEDMNPKKQADIMAQFKPKYAKEKEKRSISKILSSLSRYGMNFDGNVYTNMRAIPADPKLMPSDNLTAQEIMSSMTSKWVVKTNQEKSFFEKDLPVKREALRKLALSPELEDILDTMTNECVVYDSDFAYFAEPTIDQKLLKDFQQNLGKKVEDSINTSYYKFYRMLNWKRGAWNDFKRFLIEGCMSYEIVYNSLETPKNVVGIIPIDPATLTKDVKNGKTYWLQFKGVQGKERKLLDAQVVYIQYQENVVARQSYLERLIRPFNIYRIIEQAQIIWTITNASYKTKFTIPVHGLNKANGMQTLQAAMNRYREDIRFNAESGEVSINGQAALPFNKEYWFPESDSGEPQIEVLGGEGPELNDNDQLTFFKNELYRMSKIPTSRFEKDSGVNWSGSNADSYTREEINFGRYVTMLRNTFGQIILKPLQMQLALDVPELQQEKQILEAVSLEWHSYNLFEELMDQQIMLARTEFIQSLKDSLIDIDPEGNEQKFFSSEFLVKKYLKLSSADLKINRKYKDAEIAKMKKDFPADDEPTESVKKKTKKLLIDTTTTKLTEAPADDEPTESVKKKTKNTTTTKLKEAPIDDEEDEE